MSTWKTLLFVSRISWSISAGRKQITLHTFNSWYCFIYQRKDYSVITKLLPPKHEYVISVRLSKIQMELYEKYLQLNVTHDPNNPNRVGNVFVTLTIIRTYGPYSASHCKLFVSGDIQRYDLILWLPKFNASLDSSMGSEVEWRARREKGITTLNILWQNFVGFLSSMGLDGTWWCWRCTFEETILKRRNTDSFYFKPFKFLRAIREIERRINRQEKQEQTAEISKVNWLVVA